MKWLQRIFDFYINASIHVSFAVVSLLIITTIFLDIPVTKSLIVFVFCVTLSCYNFLKYGTDLNGGMKWHQGDLVYIGLLSFLCLLTAIYQAFQLPVQDFLLLGVLLILITLYIFPVFPRDKNLRSLGILKVIIVAFSWTGITVFLPLISAHYGINWDIAVFSLQRFLLVLALIIPFEIRDMYLDPPGIRTLPRRFGIRRTKQLGVLLAILFYVLVYFRDDIHPSEVLARALLAVVLSIIILKSPTYPAKYYASFWVEALPICWLGYIELFTI